MAYRLVSGMEIVSTLACRAGGASLPTARIKKRKPRVPAKYIRANIEEE
jgi:hypothetical protein